jgi:hypothetical protein
VRGWKICPRPEMRRPLRSAHFHTCLGLHRMLSCGDRISNGLSSRRGGFCRYVGRCAWMEDLPMPGNAPPPAVGAFPYVPWFASGVVVRGSDLERLRQPSRGSCRYAWWCAQMGDLPMPGNAPPPAVGAFPYVPWCASGVVVRGSNLERLKQPSPEFSQLRSTECADGKAALPANARL